MFAASARERKFETAAFERPMDGPCLETLPCNHIPASGLPGWRGRCKSTLTATVPKAEYRKIYVVGMFGVSEPKPAGTVVACLSFGERFRFDLVYGRHCYVRTERGDLTISPGDGTELVRFGEANVAGFTHRVDMLVIEMPERVLSEIIRFRVISPDASVVLFDIFCEHEQVNGCPFKPGSTQMSLLEVGAAVRLGDRQRVDQALGQLHEALSMKGQSLDDVKGEALTFIAVVTAAMLDLDGSRHMHRVQLDAARALDSFNTQEDVAEQTRHIIEEVLLNNIPMANPLPNERLMAKAQRLIELNYAERISDEWVAKHVGMSTSHFRHLFKVSTGMPFNKYLMSVRLEKARQLLLEQDMHVSEVATAVGYSGLAHFSRAFSQRFSVSPNQLRQAFR